MRKSTKTYALSTFGIDEFLEEFRNTDYDGRIDRTTVIRTALSFEEILLDSLHHFGDGKSFSFSSSRHYSQIDFELTVPGDPFNPLALEDNSSLNEIMGRIGLSPVYSYSNCANRFKISHPIKLKVSFALRLLIAVIAGSLLGIAGLFLPESFSENVDVILTPVVDTIFGLIKMASLPMIFLCTISGILSCGDIGTFGKVGRQTTFGYLRTMLVLLLVTVGVSLIFLDIRFSGSAIDSDVAESLLYTVFSVFPDNLLAPFANGDNIQVLVIAIIFGTGLLAMGERAERVTALLDQLRELSSMVMQWICSLMPVMVFILIAQNIWNRNELAEAMSAWKAILIILAVYLAALIVEIIMVSRKKRISFGNAVSAIAPVCLKGLATCSSIFTYTDMEKTLKNQLGADSGFTDFSLPLGLAFFHPNLILLSGITLYFASISNVDISASWIFTLLVISYLSSIAAPPVSGGFVAIIAMMFGSLGINSAYLGIASSLVMLLDYPNTGGRVGLLMLEIARMDRHHSADDASGTGKHTDFKAAQS